MEQKAAHHMGRAQGPTVGCSHPGGFAISGGSQGLILINEVPLAWW